MWRKKMWWPSFTVVGSVKWCSHHGKQCTNSSAIKNKTAIWYSNYIFGWGSSLRQRIIQQEKDFSHQQVFFFNFKPQDESVHITYEPNEIDMQPIIVEKHRPEIKFKKNIAWKQNVSRSQEKLWITGLCCVPEINGRRVEKSSVNSLGEHISM